MSLINIKDGRVDKTRVVIIEWEGVGGLLPDLEAFLENVQNQLEYNPKEVSVIHNIENGK